MADETHDEQDIVVVTGSGEYDLDTLDAISGELSAAAAAHRMVVLDASAITFADSSFLNLLIRTHHATRLRIAAPQGQLARLFEMTGADRVLDLRPSVEDALRT
ncbi:STAS domain-containing protein [Streptomyces sp. NPDC002138]|uniref:STAS domain-containing protein n=1 Tax=Streptomyces sp. NPDC002138 TaxID=3154410 RepID=UPI0033349D08